MDDPPSTVNNIDSLTNQVLDESFIFNRQNTKIYGLSGQKSQDFPGFSGTLFKFQAIQGFSGIPGSVLTLEQG